MYLQTSIYPSSLLLRFIMHRLVIATMALFMLYGSWCFADPVDTRVITLRVAIDTRLPNSEEWKGWIQQSIAVASKLTSSPSNAVVSAGTVKTGGVVSAAVTTKLVIAVRLPLSGTVVHVTVVSPSG